MALIKCPECGNNVSTQAAACPKCGYPIKVFTQQEDDEQEKESIPVVDLRHLEDEQRKEMPQANRRSKSGGFGKAILIFLAIIGGLILIGTCSGLSSGESDSFSNTESAAKVWAEHIVKQNLKSPSTAKFCNRIMEMKAESLGGAKWKVTGWVDSQNSFGATVRSDFVVKLELIKDGVRCIDIQIKSR